MLLIIMRLLNLLAIGLIILMFISAILPVFENVKSFKSASYILKADQAVRSFVSHTIPTTIKIPTKIPGTIKKIDLTRWIIIATGLSNSSFVWDSTAVPNGDFYRIRVAATDSMAIAFDTSDTAFNVNNKHTGRASVSITTFTISLAMGIMIILMIRKRRK